MVLMRCALAIVFLVGACSFDNSASLGSGTDGDGGDGNIIDGGIPDAYVTPSQDACPEWAPEHLNSCDFDDNDVNFVGSEALVYNTDTGLFEGAQTIPSVVIDQGSGENLRVIRVSSFTLNSGAVFFAEGSLPLAIAATGAIQIDGFLSVGSGPFTPPRRIFVGAGSNSSLCGTGTGQPGTDDDDGPGGAGGGGFGSPGGTGGLGDNNAVGMQSSNPGGPGGTSVTAPAIIRGGCAGGTGGVGFGGAPAGGNSGGALLLLSATSITIGSNGGIYAGGAGGLAGQMGERSGGGGGGSGGLVALDAPTVLVEGRVAANGGGGGEGSDQNGGADGDPGDRATVGEAVALGGGDNLGNAGDGGDGAAGSNDAQDGEGDVAGAGGGGGGIGFLLVWAQSFTDDGVVSPEPVVTNR